MNILYYTLGNSDLYINQSISRFNDYLNVTQKIWEEINQYENPAEQFNRNKTYISLKESSDLQVSYENSIRNIKKGNNLELTKKINNVSFPMFEALMINLYADNFKPDTVFLFATKQAEPHPQDTFFTAKILRLFINEKYRISFDDIIINEITDNPSDYNLMSEYFKKFAKDYKNYLKESISNITQVSAGTPAMYFNLALVLSEYNTKYYYISFDKAKKASIARQIDYFEKLNKERYIYIIGELLNSYSYNKAAAVVENSPFRNDSDIVNMLNLLSFKVNFDLKKMNESAKKISEKTRNQLQGFFKAVSQLNIASQNYDKIKKYIFIFMVENAEIYLRQKNYYNLIILVFTILENFKNDILLRKGVIIRKTADKFNEFNNFMAKEENADFIKELEKKELNYRDNPSTLVLNELIKYLYKSEADKYIKFNNLLEKYNFYEIRNLFTHKFNLSLTFPYEDNSAQGLLDDLKEILAEFGLFEQNHENYYDKCNEIILQHLH